MVNVSFGGNGYYNYADYARLKKRSEDHISSKPAQLALDE